jgi:hypothetical protein
MKKVRRLSRSLSLVACVICLAGCDAPRVNYQWISTGYNRADLSYAADRRDVRVEVRGGPPSLPAPAFAAAVADAMPTALGVSPRFTATPDASAQPLYRVVWDFAPGGLGREVCGALPAGPSAVRSGGVYAVFCRGPSPMSAAYGEFARPLDPADPVFRAFVRDMTLAMFPLGNTGRGGF